MSNYKLVTIDQRFIAETIARTGSEHLLDKAGRMFVGLYDDTQNWYIPLRANLSLKKPAGTYFETPFPNKNPHFKRPGLDFQYALFVPERYIHKIGNTLPIEQAKFIFQKQNEIKKNFENYVLGLENISESSMQYKISTVPLFPEGIEKIKEQAKERNKVNTEKIEHIENLLEHSNINSFTYLGQKFIPVATFKKRTTISNLNAPFEKTLSSEDYNLEKFYQLAEKYGMSEVDVFYVKEHGFYVPTPEALVNVTAPQLFVKFEEVIEKSMDKKENEFNQELFQNEPKQSKSSQLPFYDFNTEDEYEKMSKIVDPKRISLSDTKRFEKEIEEEQAENELDY